MNYYSDHNYYWENDDFPCFLEYLVRTYQYGTKLLINVVAEPHKWEDEYFNKFRKEMEENE